MFSLDFLSSLVSAADFSRKLPNKAAAQSQSFFPNLNLKSDERPFCGVFVSRDAAKSDCCGGATTRLRASRTFLVMSSSGAAPESRFVARRQQLMSILV
jgi:hypothetical protein